MNTQVLGAVLHGCGTCACAYGRCWGGLTAESVLASSAWNAVLGSCPKPVFQYFFFLKSHVAFGKLYGKASWCYRRLRSFLGQGLLAMSSGLAFLGAAPE